MNAMNRLEGQRASPSFERLNGDGGVGGNTHVSCQLTPSRPFLFKMLSRLILGRTRKFIHSPWYKLGGGGGRLNPSQEFLMCCSISKQFCLQWKAFDLLNKMRYILWVVGLLEACDVDFIKN